MVTTTGPANAGAVAEYSFALLLALLRHVSLADAGMRVGAWSRAPLVGEALESKTLGIVGFGAVGSRVARIAAGFGMRVIAASGRIAAAAPVKEASLGWGPIQPGSTVRPQPRVA